MLLQSWVQDDEGDGWMNPIEAALRDFYLRIITSCQQNACCLPHFKYGSQGPNKEIFLSYHKDENEDYKMVENDNIKHQRQFGQSDRFFSPKSEF